MIHLEHELDLLKDKLLHMASLAESAVHRAVQAALERNETLAEQVKEDDSQLDQLEIEVDETAVYLLAKAPLASQLRFITVAMKISHDLERVGDEATTIARQALALSNAAPVEPIDEIPRMVEIALDLLKKALDAFVHNQPELARQSIPEDKQVDALNKQVRENLIRLMELSPETISRRIEWMIISKSLERIADHATNIAEEVVYLHEGQDIRHTGKAPLSPA